MKAGGHREFYILLATEVLDHDAQAANMLLNTVLGILRRHELVDWEKITSLWLVCDCGPHFRSYENAAHFLYTLVKSLKLTIHVVYLGEQHGKGSCDRLFGWTNAWLEDYLQYKPIHGLANLVTAYTQGAARMMREDPAGPLFVIRSYDPGAQRPSLRKQLHCPDFKITRSYSLTAKPSPYASTGVVIRNNVFTDLKAKEIMGGWSITEFTTPAEQTNWRRGYYDKPRAWELAGPQAGDENELTRKFSGQKQYKSEDMPLPKRSLEEKLSAKARSLSKASVKKRRQLRSLRPSNEESSSSTSSSSSSSSSS